MTLRRYAYADRYIVVTADDPAHYLRRWKARILRSSDLISRLRYVVSSAALCFGVGMLTAFRGYSRYVLFPLRRYFWNPWLMRANFIRSLGFRGVVIPRLSFSTGPSPIPIARLALAIRWVLFVFLPFANFCTFALSRFSVYDMATFVDAQMPISRGTFFRLRHPTVVPMSDAPCARAVSFCALQRPTLSRSYFTRFAHILYARGKRISRFFFRSVVASN